MSYERIFYDNEDKYKDINNKKLKEFILKFLKLNLVDIYIDFDLDVYENFIYLKDYVYKYYPEAIKLFHSTLQESGYRFQHNIIDIISDLGFHTNKKISQSILKKLELSPYIKNIHYENNKIYLETIYQNYELVSIWDYFKDNYELLNYLKMNKNGLCGNCHKSSWEFIKYLDSYTSLITGLCPHIFYGTYYHSVLRDNLGYIIDLANGIVYDEGVMNNLFQNKIISEVKKDNLDAKLDEAIEMVNDKTIIDDFHEPLIIALHKQAMKG